MVRTVQWYGLVIDSIPSLRNELESVYVCMNFTDFYNVCRYEFKIFPKATATLTFNRKIISFRKRGMDANKYISKIIFA